MYNFLKCIYWVFFIGTVKLNQNYLNILCWIHGVKLIFCEISAFKISFPVHPFQLHFLLKAFNFFLYLSLNLYFCSNIKIFNRKCLAIDWPHFFWRIFISSLEFLKNFLLNSLMQLSFLIKQCFLNNINF